MRRRSFFNTVRSEGSILPMDLLVRVGEGDDALGFVSPNDYQVDDGERVEDAVSSSWNALIGEWWDFQSSLRDPDADQSKTALTRDAWLLPLLKSIDYEPERLQRAVEVEDRAYPISHFNRNLPIHLVGWDIDLGTKTPSMRGAARSSPHSLLQEFLNRSDDHLWGVVSNGRYLRILRDNVSLTRQAFVEFDLEAMMVGEVYADFALLWRLLHATRYSGARPSEWIVEKWSRAANAQGVRALDSLRSSVERALQILGTGFIAHPANSALIARLDAGALTHQEFYRELLRLLYRVIFLLVAEARELLLIPGTDSPRARRYERYFSVSRLRVIGDSPHSRDHADLYRSLKVVFAALDESGIAELGLPAFGSFLWSADATPDLDRSDLWNGVVLDAMRELTVTTQRRVSTDVDFKNLGTEELGSIYESLLELHPDVQLQERGFSLTAAEGHERRTSGSYYTPTELINVLLDSSLEPLLDRCASSDDPERALLNLKVCDPACGSGHFLVAAAHRIAKRLAGIRTGEDEPPPEAVLTALREVVSRCVYGVDVNEMAVELCKVSLWMESMEPGRPLSFLDAHIRKGNSLIGTTPELIAGGVPDGAFTPLTGDHKPTCSALKKRNRAERQSRIGDAVQLGLDLPSAGLPLAPSRKRSVAAGSLDELHQQEQAFRNWLGSADYVSARRVGDAWCAAFFQEKILGRPHITDGDLQRIATDGADVSADIRELVDSLAAHHEFFHWHLEFPDVFLHPNGNDDAFSGPGFDVVLGNPPWERIKVQEKEWFGGRSPEVAGAPNAAVRRQRIEGLKEKNPALYQEFRAAGRNADAVGFFLRGSGRYPLCGRGDVNTYSVFAELMRSLTSPSGRVGTVIPSGIATDDTTKFFFADIVEHRSLISLYDFENAVGLFPGVGHGRFKFCLLTLAGSEEVHEESADFAFFLHHVSDLEDRERRFALASDDFRLLNPITLTCPTFRSKTDAELTKDLYRRIPVLGDQHTAEPWSPTFLRMFDMSGDSELFRTADELEREGWLVRGNAYEMGENVMLPLYEAKMFHQFNHRFGDYSLRPAGSRDSELPPVPIERMTDPQFRPMPRYWVGNSETRRRLGDHARAGWVLAYRNICRATDERTIISSILPLVGVGHSAPLILVGSADDALLLCTCLNSLVADYVCRQKLGGTNLTYGYLQQLAIPSRERFDQECPWENSSSLRDWILDRSLELVYSSSDLSEFAQEVGYSGPPTTWDPERRLHLRSELDAALFHLYGLDRARVEHVLGAFPIVRRNDERAFGEYRTASLILKAFDRLDHESRAAS